MSNFHDERMGSFGIALSALGRSSIFGKVSPRRIILPSHCMLVLNQCPASPKLETKLRSALPYRRSRLRQSVDKLSPHKDSF